MQKFHFLLEYIWEKYFLKMLLRVFCPSRIPIVAFFIPTFSQIAVLLLTIRYRKQITKIHHYFSYFKADLPENYQEVDNIDIKRGSSFKKFLKHYGHINRKFKSVIIEI